MRERKNRQRLELVTYSLLLHDAKTEMVRGKFAFLLSLVVSDAIEREKRQCDDPVLKGGRLTGKELFFL